MKLSDVDQAQHAIGGNLHGAVESIQAVELSLMVPVMRSPCSPRISMASVI